MEPLVLPEGWEKRGSVPVFFTNGALGLTTYELYVATANEEDFWSCSKQAYSKLWEVPLGDGTGKNVLKVYQDGNPLPHQIQVIQPAAAPARVRKGPALKLGRMLPSDKPPRLPAPWHEKARDGDYVVFENRETGQRCADLWGVEEVEGGESTYFCWKKGERWDTSPAGVDGKRTVLVAAVVDKSSSTSPTAADTKSVSVSVSAAAGKWAGPGKAPAPASVSLVGPSGVKKWGAAATVAKAAAPAPSPPPPPPPPAAPVPEPEPEAVLAMPAGWTAHGEEGEDPFFAQEGTGLSVWALWLAMPIAGTVRYFNCGTWEESTSGRPDIAADDETAAIVGVDGSRHAMEGGEEAVGEGEVQAQGDGLPAGWSAVTDEDGTFYYNADTGESTWDRPT